MAIGIFRSTPAAAAPAPERKSAPPSAPPVPSAPADRSETSAAEGPSAGAQPVVQGLAGAFSPQLRLSAEQKKGIQEAAPNLKKLAGADGKWGPDDLADNVQAIGGNFFTRRLVESGLREGFEKMTGKPVDPLTGEQKAAAAERWEALSPEQQQAHQLSIGDVKGVGAALESVRDSTVLSKAAPKPASIPGELLDKLSKVKNPTVADLLEAQKPPVPK
jgi:hypothetical protein